MPKKKKLPWQETTDKDEEILLSLMCTILAAKSGVRDEAEASNYLSQALLLRARVSSFVTFEKTK